MSAPKSPEIERLRREIAARAVEVEGLFKSEVFVTVFVRNTSGTDGDRDVLVTNDPDDGMMVEALRRRSSRERRS